MLGYEGYGIVDGEYFLCTGMSVPKNEVRIDSGGSWGGNDTTSKFGINVPRVYDYPSYDGSLDYDVSENMFIKMKEWLFDRTSTKKIEVYPTYDSSQIYNECIWNSMSFTASEGAFCTSSCGFLALDRDEVAIGSDYINNKFGSAQEDGFTQNLPHFVDSCGNKNPIPYWRTSIESSILLPSNVELLSWTLSLDQQIEKYYLCDAIGGDPRAPAYIGLGPLSASLEMELLVISGNITIPDADQTIAEMVLNIDEESIILKELEIQTFEQGIKGQNETTSHSVTLQIFDMAAS